MQEMTEGEVELRHLQLPLAYLLLAQRGEL